jgi:hypothetical protein
VKTAIVIGATVLVTLLVVGKLTADEVIAWVADAWRSARAAF